MGQEEVINYLILKKGKFVSIPELCKAINVNRSNISRACKILKKNGEVSFKEEKKGSFIRYLFAIKFCNRYIYKDKGI